MLNLLVKGVDIGLSTDLSTLSTENQLVAVNNIHNSLIYYRRKMKKLAG